MDFRVGMGVDLAFRGGKVNKPEVAAVIIARSMAKAHERIYKAFPDCSIEKIISSGQGCIGNLLDIHRESRLNPFVRQFIFLFTMNRFVPLLHEAPHTITRSWKPIFFNRIVSVPAFDDPEALLDHDCKILTERMGTFT